MANFERINSGHSVDAHQLQIDLRSATWCIAILVARLGGEVTISLKELEEARSLTIRQSEDLGAGLVKIEVV